MCLHTHTWVWLIHIATHTPKLWQADHHWLPPVLLLRRPPPSDAIFCPRRASLAARVERSAPSSALLACRWLVQLVGWCGSW